MKKILFRKLMSDYLIFLSLALLSTGIVIWVFQAVNYLDIMIEDGRDYLVYINFSILNFPKTISKIYPFILFFSLFYITVKYELNNELIISNPLKNVSYNNSSSFNKNCTDSITGNNDFSYCGPTPYNF